MIRYRNKFFKDIYLDKNTCEFYDKDGNHLKKDFDAKAGRWVFRGREVYRLMAHTYLGYKKGMDIHHLNEDKTDDRLCNLQYIEHGEHSRIHNTEKCRHYSDPNRNAKISEAAKSNGVGTRNKGRHAYTNGTINVIADVCPEGFHPGMTQNHKDPHYYCGENNPAFGKHWFTNRTYQCFL